MCQRKDSPAATSSRERFANHSVFIFRNVGTAGTPQIEDSFRTDSFRGAAQISIHQTADILSERDA
jgi:hypothetical protein